MPHDCKEDAWPTAAILFKLARRLTLRFGPWMFLVVGFWGEDSGPVVLELTFIFLPLFAAKPQALKLMAPS